MKERIWEQRNDALNNGEALVSKEVAIVSDCGGDVERQRKGILTF